LSAIKIDTSLFADLAADINLEVTGDANDDRGIKFVVNTLDWLSHFTGPIVFDGTEVPYKVDFRIQAMRQ